MPEAVREHLRQPGSMLLQTSAYASRSGEAGSDMLNASGRSFSEVITVHPKGTNISSAQPMRSA